MGIWLEGLQLQGDPHGEERSSPPCAGSSWRCVGLPSWISCRQVRGIPLAASDVIFKLE